ncbi:cell wall metabolism sensor histidine kinase WalK [Ruminococcus flavefaciens]|uniref:sensor histidine kinase n=1 Tax=Ruminococcus flavefaciens TaxID=1265 RepID=UPI0026E92E7C|nr:HAMP domain-containing sensor histidine kinase [Ruminococcus flavefaciens]
MKNKLFKRRPKRTTFRKIFAKAMIIPILLTAFVGFNIVPLGNGYIQSRTESQNDTDLNNLVNWIEKGDTPEKQWNRPIDFAMCVSASRVISTDGIFFNTGAAQYIMGTTYDDPKSAGVKWSFDKDGNILLSNRAKMWAIIHNSKGMANSIYCKFDPEEFDIPELNELFAEYFKDMKETDLSYSFHLKSLYLNEETNQMIPHEIEVNKFKTDYFYDEFDNAYYKDEPKPAETRNIVINADEEGFELVELVDRNSPDDYPSAGIFAILGADPAAFDDIYQKYKEYTSGEGTQKGMQGNGNNTDDFYYKHDLAENKYGASGCISVTRINLLNRHAVRKYVFITAMVFIISTLIALLLSIVRNAKNKAQYAFEDYQRALTNNLAHDLKTPLAVIGGYAENLMEMRRNSADGKELKYLSSIMNNVSYTDDIIAKTLQLSETEQIKKLNKTKVDIKALAEKSAEKYSTALEERSIDLKIEGKCEVTADEYTLAAAVENLISNAVKYTRDGGSIKITSNKKRFTVVNDVAENIDTKDLLMPFVKGDKARSDKSSSGLGLAIASAAAAQNGFRVKVDCKDKKFTAAVEF